MSILSVVADAVHPAGQLRVGWYGGNALRQDRAAGAANRVTAPNGAGEQKERRALLSVRDSNDTGL